MVQLNPEDMRPVINRLKRAQGQLAAVVRMLEEGQDCQQVMQQLSAASKAVDRAGFAVISSGMEQCLSADSDPLQREADRAAMEKLFLSLA